MKAALLALALTALIALVIAAHARHKKRRLDMAFAGRAPKSPEDFHESFFRSQGIPFEVVAGVRQVLEEHLDADLSRLQASDDFSTNLSFFWEFDSLANVEIVRALEERFGIRIADEEAVAAHTVADLVALVSRKVGAAA